MVVVVVVVVAVAVAVVVVVVAVVVVVMVVAGPQKRPEQAGIRAKPQRERPNEGPTPPRASLRPTT